MTVQSATFDGELRKLNYINYTVVVVPKTVISALQKDESSGIKLRIIVEIEGLESWKTGLVAIGDGDAGFTINSDRLQFLKIEVGEYIRVTITSDVSTYGVDVPVCVEEYWLQLPESKDAFELLTPSMKRYTLKHIDAPKSELKKIERCHQLFQNILIYKGQKITFGQLLGK